MQYLVDGVLAIRGSGKYHLSQENVEFYRNPTKWNQMSIESKEEVIDKFSKYTPGQTVYQKPGSFGLKSSSGENKGRVNLPERKVFENRSAQPASPKHRTLIIIRVLVKMMDFKTYTRRRCRGGKRHGFADYSY